MDFFKQMMEGIERASLALGVYFNNILVSWINAQVKIVKAYLGFWGETKDKIPSIDKTQEVIGEAYTVAESRLHTEIQEELQQAKEQGGFVGWLKTVVILFNVSLGKLFAFSKGIQALRAQVVNEDLKPSLVSIEALLRAELLNPTSTDYLDPIIAKWGLPDSSLKVYRSAMRQLPAFQELLVLRNRNEITTKEAKTYLSLHGYNEEDAGKLLELRFFYPGAADLVSLAGREAFEEDQITKFDLDRDFDKIPKWIFEKAGVTDEVARWYWVAHWNNPSIQQFWEMVHRKAERLPGVPWSIDDADDYARLADINPSFVPGLRDIAYRPLTRVDVRRMNRDGVLGYEGIEKSYTDLGYSPVTPPGGKSDVTLMSEWTIKFNARAERELTKTQILNMYELRQISPKDIVTYLELIGYESDQARDIKDLADNQREEKRLRSFIRRGEYEYKRGFEKPDVVRGRLIDEFIEPEQIDGMFQEWDNEMVYEQALPSKEDVLGWFPTRINETELRNHLRSLRYTDANIDLYVQSEGEARLSKTDILRLLDQREIMEEKAITDLKALGYTPEDAMALIGPVLKRIARRDQREQDAANNGGITQAAS